MTINTKPRLIPMTRYACQRCRKGPAQLELRGADDKPIGIYCPRCGNGLLRRLLRMEKRNEHGGDDA